MSWQASLTLSAPARYLRHAKASALVDVLAAALLRDVLDLPNVQAAVVALCAPDASPPAVYGAPAADEATPWGDVVTATVEALPALINTWEWVNMATSMTGRLPSLFNGSVRRRALTACYAGRFLTVLTGSDGGADTISAAKERCVLESAAIDGL